MKIHLDFWKSSAEDLVNICMKYVNKGVEIHSFIFYAIKAVSIFFQEFFRRLQGTGVVVLFQIAPRRLSRSVVKGSGKATGAAEAAETGNLSDRKTSVFKQREAFADAVFCQILRDCLTCHAFEETTAGFSCEMYLVCQFAKRDIVTIVQVQIFQKNGEPSQVILAGKCQAL